MIKLPYDIVYPYAEQLIISVAMCKNFNKSLYYWDLYLAYIKMCGWTDKELDQETLKRIDKNWEENWN